MTRDEELQALQAELAKREELESLQAELARRETFGDNDQEYTNKPADYSTASSNSESPLTRIGGVFTHGLSQSAGGLADLANMATQNMEGGFSLENDLKGTNTSDANSPSYSLKEYKPGSVSQMVGQKVNQLFGTNLEPKDAFEKFVHLMGEFSLPLGPVGGGSGKAASALGRMGQNISKVAKHEAIAAGGAAGIVGAEEAGVENELGKMAAGIGGSALATTNPLKTAMKVSGITGKGFSKEAVEAAERLGVELPLVAATDSKAVSIAHNLVGNTPVFGDAVTNKVKTASNQYQEAWDKLLNTIGRKTEDLAKEGKDIYAGLEALMPAGDTLDPTPWLDKIKEIKGKLKTVVYSPKTEQLLKKLNQFEDKLSPQSLDMPEYLQTASESVKKSFAKQMDGIQVGKKQIKEIPVVEVIQQKRELNSLMKDKDLFDGSDKRTLNFFKGLSKTTDDMLQGYGKKHNPEFIKALNTANQEYTGIAKRDAIDSLLGDKIAGLVTEEPQYNALIKALQKKDNQKFLKNNFGAENYDKLKDFVQVAKAMEKIKRTNPNPSGTGWMTALGGIATGLYAAPAYTVGVLGSLEAGKKLLTSNKFLNLAKRYAKDQDQTTADKLKKVIEDIGGVTVLELNQQIQGAIQNSSS